MSGGFYKRCSRLEDSAASKRGPVNHTGFTLFIEVPKGGERTGKDSEGNKWSRKLNNAYGYFKGSEGHDGDAVDVFLGEVKNPDNVYVVDQVKPDGSFDEHKVMLGFNSVSDARRAYLSNYEKGWKGCGAITACPVDEFRRWLESGTRKRKPFAEYSFVKG